MNKQLNTFEYIQKLMLVLIFAVCDFSATAQDFNSAWNKECNCYGYKDRKGNLVIAYKYASAGIFSEGLACVRLNQKSGFIDKDNNTVISLIYDNARSFSEGLAAVKLNNKWGFIDNKGVLVIPITLDYERVEQFHEGLANVKLNGKWGYIDKKGSLVIPLQYDVAFEFSEGLAAVQPVSDKGYGFINKNGEMVIPVQFKYANSFADDGIALVSTATNPGFHIDKKGTVLDGDNQKTSPTTVSTLQACELAAKNLQYPGTVDEAVATLKKIDAEGDVPAAAYYLANGFEKGYIHAPQKEIDSAIYYYQKSAIKGWLPAMYCLGLLYQYANGKTYPTPAASNKYNYLIDKKKARYWFNESIKNGNNSPLLLQNVALLDKAIAETAEKATLSTAYNKGYDAFEAKNYEAAYRWWKVAAFEGQDAAAFFGLAIIHHLGKAPENSYITAMEYYQKAADMGLKDALVEKQKVQDYLDAVKAARQKAAAASSTTSAATIQGESYNEWWEKTYGRGGTQNRTAMPNNNLPQASYRTGTQSESDRHQQAMDAIQRSIERQQARDYHFKNQ